MILKNKDEILAGGSAAAPKKVMAKSSSVSKLQSTSDKVRLYKRLAIMLCAVFSIFISLMIGKGGSSDEADKFLPARSRR